MAFPQTPLSTTAELYIDGGWTDITSSVRTASPGGPITITRGRSDESSRVTPSRCTLTLNNRTGTFSPRNPNSTYYGKIGRNTKLRIREAGVITDTFTRTTSNGWGTATSGQAWTVYGTASEWATNGSIGTVTFNEVNVSRYALLEGRHTDIELVGSFGSNELATGAEQQTGFVARYQSTGDHYWMRLGLTVAGDVWIDIVHTASDGTTTTLGTVDTGLTHVASTLIRCRFSINGTTLRARAWAAAGSEGTTWMLDVTDSTIGGAGRFGTRSKTTTGNTNGSMVFQMDNFVVDDVRFVGEVAQWPPRWDNTGRDVYVQIEANGILRRLQQGASPLRSQLRRGLEAQEHVAYWPMEDDSNAVSLASADATGTGTTMLINETIKPGTSEFVGLEGSLPLPLIEAGGTFRGLVSMPGATAWTVQIVTYVVYDNSAECNLFSWKTEGGSPAWWSIVLTTGGGIKLQGADSSRVAISAFDNTVLFVAAADGSSAEGRWITITCIAAQNGADIDYSIVWNFAAADSAQGLWWTDTGTLGAITAVNVGPYNAALAGTALGHVFITDDDSGGVFGRNDTAFMGARTERAGRRILRLCEEEGVPCSILGDPDLTVPVGPQAISTLYELLQDAAEADGGILCEMRGEVGVAYRTLRSQLNQHTDPQIELDYDASHLVMPFDPTEDDAFVRNDVTATKRGGSSARDVVTTGPLSSLAPPNGVGVYDDNPIVNVYDDDILPDIAGWKTHLGTWDEARYPVVCINMARSVIVASPTMVRKIAGANLGDCMTIDNPPAWMPPDLIELIVQGSVERRSQFGWDFEFNTVPAGPYRAFVVEDDELGRVDTTGSTLDSSATTTATSLSVATTTPADGLWTVDAADCPFDIEIGGERITVTAIAGGASPQTFTVTRSVNGIVKSHSSGATVKLWKPGVLAVIGDELGVITAGKVPSAAELNALGESVQTIEKTADESVTSSTTFQADNELLFSSLAVGEYEMSGEIWYTGTSASNQDIKIRWAWPSGSGGYFNHSEIGNFVDWSNSSGQRDMEINGEPKATASPTAASSFGTITSANEPIMISGRLVVNAAGALTLEWAQVTSNATATTVKAGSWITLRKVA